jgi:hypothetical protein
VILHSSSDIIIILKGPLAHRLLIHIKRKIERHKKSFFYFYHLTSTFVLQNLSLQFRISQKVMEYGLGMFFCNYNGFGTVNSTSRFTLAV